MNNHNRKRMLLAAIPLVWGGVTFAQTLDTVVQAGEQVNDAARQSQERIDNTVNQTNSLASEYSAVMKEVDGLEVYNALLARQVRNQEQTMAQLDASMDEVNVIERQVTPLMLRMIDGLEQFVSLDIPFLEEERAERLGNLRTIMERSDVSVAEKFRKVLEAYQIESEYGRTIESYKGTVSSGGGETEVEFLRVGRLGLFYQTSDGTTTGRWDNAGRQWEDLGDTYRNQVKAGLNIANKKVAPDLFIVPMAATGGQ